MMILKATRTDAAALASLVNSAYRGESSKKGWTTEAGLLDGMRTDEAALKELLAQPDTCILKSVDTAGALNGCVCLEKQSGKLYLGMLTVAPGLQNSGIGKQLLHAAESYAQEQHCSTIEMTVISVRQELISWYERHGYMQTGATKPFPADEFRFGIPKKPLMFLILQKSLR